MQVGDLVQYIDPHLPHGQEMPLVLLGWVVDIDYTMMKVGKIRVRWLNEKRQCNWLHEMYVRVV